MFSTGTKFEGNFLLYNDEESFLHSAKKTPKRRMLTMFHCPPQNHHKIIQNLAEINH